MGLFSKIKNMFKGYDEEEKDAPEKEIEEVDSPTKMPDRTKIKEIREPYIRTNIFVPSDYIGPIMELCEGKRGDYIGMDYIDPTRVDIHYEIPLAEIVCLTMKLVNIQ